MDPYQRIEGISKVGFTVFFVFPEVNFYFSFIGFYAFFLRPEGPREPAFSSTGLHPPPALFQA